ncbi:hypothetical protein WMY93_022657 [Mugilogobius chulae]|uniref:Uncharacterized protein n=1 Tax=Mugilogobius chulae TaxID=88201 RepID=A0AAW0N7J8_9GOBI
MFSHIERAADPFLLFARFGPCGFGLGSLICDPQVGLRCLNCQNIPFRDVLSSSMLRFHRHIRGERGVRQAHSGARKMSVSNGSSVTSVRRRTLSDQPLRSGPPRYSRAPDPRPLPSQLSPSSEHVRLKPGAARAEELPL